MAGHEQNDAPKHYFAVQKRVLAFVGLLLTSKYGIVYRIYSISVLVLMFSDMFFLSLELFTTELDFSGLANNVMYEIGVFAALVKYFVCYIKRRQLRKIFDLLENGPFLSEFRYRENTQIIWIKNAVNFTQKLSFAGAMLAFCSVLFGVLTSIFTKTNQNDHTLPFGTMTYLTDNIEYKTVLAYESVAAFTVMLTFVHINIVYASFIIHLCVQCRILQDFIKSMNRISYTLMIKKNNLELIGSNNEMSQKYEPSNLQWRYLRQILKESVLFHTAILNVSDEVEAVFNLQILAEFVGMTACFCFLIYHATLFPVSDIRFQKDVGLLVSAIFPLFVLSYWGNELINSSQAIAEACYELNFVGIDVRLQRGLMLIIQRSQKPITLTVGKFAALSLVSMMSFCRGIYSYFMLLRRMNDE